MKADTNYKIEEIRDDTDDHDLVDVPLTEETAHLIRDAYEQMIERAKAVLERACKIRGEQCFCDEIHIEWDTIRGTGIWWLGGESEGLRDSVCPLAWLFMDNWEDLCRKDHELATQQKKADEAAAKAKKEKETADRERAEFLRLSKKFAGGAE